MLSGSRGCPDPSPDTPHGPQGPSGPARRTASPHLRPRGNQKAQVLHELRFTRDTPSPACLSRPVPASVLPQPWLSPQAQNTPGDPRKERMSSSGAGWELWTWGGSYSTGSQQTRVTLLCPKIQEAGGPLSVGKQRGVGEQGRESLLRNPKVRWAAHCFQRPSGEQGLRDICAPTWAGGSPTHRSPTAGWGAVCTDGGWLHRPWCLPRRQRHSALRRGDVLTPATAWLDVEDTVKSERHHSQKDPRSSESPNSRRQEAEGWVPGRGGGQRGAVGVSSGGPPTGGPCTHVLLTQRQCPR